MIRRVLLAPKRLWDRSLPVRMVVTTLLASVVIFTTTGWFLLGQSTRGIMEGKTQASVAEATAVVTSMRTALTTTDPGTMSVNEQVSRLARDAAGRGQAGNQYYVLAETPVALIGTGGLAQTSIPDTIRSAMSGEDGLWSVPTVILFTDGRPPEPGLVVAAQLTQTGGSSYPIFFLFPTTAESQTLAVVQQATLATGAVLMLGLGLMSYLIALLALRPVRAARVAAERLAAGHLDDRIRVVGTADLAGLATSMNHMAEELDKKITQLEDLSSVQQRFVSDVSHELRAPMTTIRMAAEVIHSHRSGFDASTSRSAELLSAEVDRFEALLTELLEISRFDAGAAVLSADVIDLGKLVETELHGVQSLADEMGCALSYVMDGPMLAEADGRRIRRIVRNLLNNAIEHGPGAPVDVIARGDDDAVAIGVRDHGVGLTADDAARVFDRFWRADPSRTRRVGGTGLGLSIALEDARLHGGWLDVWGRPGQGAWFRLTLPRRSGARLAHSPLPAAPDDQEADHE